MDMLADVVERDTTAVNNGATDKIKSAAGAAQSGFPELYQPEKVSNWRVRLQQKKRNSQQKGPSAPRSTRDTATKVVGEKTEITEAEKIHRENVELMSKMSPEQIEAEREELLGMLGPKVVEALISRSSKRASKLFPEMEGAAGTWVGGSRERPDMPLPDDESVDKALGVTERGTERATEEDVYNYPDTMHEDEDDIAPQEYQFIQKMDHMTNEELLQDVHFVRNDAPTAELDLKDPAFMEKLHERYFPDLAIENNKLEWMKPLTETSTGQHVEIDDVSECRFDFKGDMVPPDRQISSTRTGLHHHSDNPQLAGYTLVELEHLSRSSFAPQRCIAIQTLGRVLYKLGKQSYYQLVPSVDSETYAKEGGVTGVMNKIYSMFWDLIKSLSIIETLQVCADETKTKNINVRNYAIEALWLWKQAGGDPRTKKSPIP
ncbi:HCL665Cp [Eremothecium sinecaudum]|uniref:HCL665Cp n=1 Tax=Eremothecium sinecaudum TaxID=45286 RepID=A0A120K1M1_9SACH|nr:HCL665Cp [Eremothecium sinecaudum]AMD19486.1 HCL665Cp [Eremothecium sinecaudum]